MEETKQSSLAKKIVKGMAVVLFFWLFWKFGGFLLSVIIGNLYPPGKEPAADAYAHVYKYIVFAFIYSSALKILIPAFVPIFIDKMNRDGESSAWEFAYSIINIMLIGAIAVSAIGIFAAPAVVNLLVPGFSLETRELCIRLLKIMLPGCIGMVLSMVMMSVLNSYKVFSYPAAGDAAQKLVWAAALFLGVKLLGLDARTVAYGFLAGCIVQVAVNIFGLRKKRQFYRPLITNPYYPRFLKELGWLAVFGVTFFAAAYWSKDIVQSAAAYAAPGADIQLWTRMFIFTSGLLLVCGYSAFLWARSRKRSSTAARFAALVAPLLIGVAFARYRDIVTSFFQSFTKAGVFADVEFSKNIGNLPIVLVAYGLSVAMFPYLCELASGKDMKTFATLVTRALRMIAIFFIPLSIVMILLNRPIIALIYDRGNWSDLHVGYAATALAFYVFALFFYAIENVVMQSYFSMQRMWMPTLLGIIAALVQVAFLFVGIRVLRYDRPYDIFLAVTLAYPLSRIFKNLALLAILRLRMPILPMRETVTFAAKLAVVCLAFAAVVHGSNRVLENLTPMTHFKKADVVLDTFNAENTSWTSRDADELTVERVSGGAVGLVARYRPLTSREISLDRELGYFRLADVSQVSFVCRTDVASAKGEPDGASWKPQRLIVEIAFDNETWRSEPVDIGIAWPDSPHTIPVPSGLGRARRVSLIIPRESDGATGLFSSLKPRPPTPRRTLLLKELRFRSGGREIITDSFAQPTPDWQTPDDVLLVSATSEDDAGEQALMLVSDGTARRASRDLAGYDLRDTAGLRLKVKSSRGGELDVALFDAAGNRFYRAFAIDPSDSRKSYVIGFEKFPGAIDPSRLERVQFGFRPDAGGMPERVWLDNVTFVAGRGPLWGLAYEVAKFVHVAIPCLAGGIVLIALVFLLRIEEGRLVLDWVVEQGRERLAVLRRRRSAQ